MRKRTNGVSLPALGAWLAVAVAVGAATAFVPAKNPVKCNNQACDTDYGVCFNTDIKANCTGEDPCHSAICTQE